MTHVSPEQSWVCHSRHWPKGKEMTYAEESTQRCVLPHHMHSMAWLVQLAQLVRRAQGVLQGRALWLCGLPEQFDRLTESDKQSFDGGREQPMMLDKLITVELGLVIECETEIPLQ